MRGCRLLVGVALMLSSCAAKAAPTLYFLSIGSSRYLEPQGEDGHGFQKLDGARNGAIALSERLSEGGARFGISLTSPEGTIVGLADVDQALSDLLKRVAVDKASDPILIIYIAAHGISDGFAWNHFSVPGDLIYQGEPEQLPPDQLADKTIYAAALVDRLNKAKVHYVLILDTCYEGKASAFNSPILSATAAQNIADIAKTVRFVNEFHQADPVLFSTTPGSTVPVAPDPTDPTSNSMGPLARRLVMLIDAKKSTGRPISIGEIVTTLQSRSADPITGPAVTNAKPAPWWSSMLYIPGAKVGELDERSGAATIPRLCCMADTAFANAKAVPVFGTITLAGGVGEFITGGTTIALRERIALERPDPMSIRFGCQIPMAAGR